MKLVGFCFAMVLLCGSSTQQNGESILEIFPEFMAFKATIQARNTEIELMENDVKVLKGQSGTATADLRKDTTTVVNPTLQELRNRSGVLDMFRVPYIRENTVKSKIVTFTFNPGFLDIPVLTYRFMKLHTDKRTNLRVYAEISKLTKSGFTMRVQTWDRSATYSAVVSWMACPKFLEI